MPSEKAPPSLAKTPLHRCHLQLGARMVPFAGFEMPVQYSGVLEEAKHVRKSAGLFDVSHMGQFSIAGNDSLLQIQRLVTNDLTRISRGQAQYNMLCNPQGGVIDDIVVYRRSEKETFICVNASNRSADLDWIRSHLTSSVQLEDQSDATALLALQGPLAETILSRHADAACVRALKYYWAVETPVFGKPCFLSRTGYTGEDGFELYLKSEHAIEVWEKLIESGRKDGLVPCGLGARDILRLEMGYPLHGHELSPTLSPLAAGLAWVVKLKRTTPFIGQEALKKESEDGSPRVLKAFRLKDRRLARQGYRIANRAQESVGEVTSGGMSPHLGMPIALAYVNKNAVSEPLSVEVRESFIDIELAQLPFVESHTKHGS